MSRPIYFEISTRQISLLKWSFNKPKEYNEFDQLITIKVFFDYAWLRRNHTVDHY